MGDMRASLRHVDMNPRVNCFWKLCAPRSTICTSRVCSAPARLPALFDLADRSQGAAALQRLLTDAIEALRPGAETPHDSGQWRAYQILRRRYTEQAPQTTVAADLGLSVRHVQREEKGGA